MKTTSLFSLFLFALLSPTAWSGQCLCPKYPVFLLPSGDWFHYSTVSQTAPGGCQFQYATGYIGAQAYGKSCSACSDCCINCYPLVTEPSSLDIPSEMYFRTLPKYDAVSSAAGMKQFLKESYTGSGNADAYDEFSFSGPFGGPLGQNPQKPIVVVLQRRGVDFHAVVWEMKRPAVDGHTFLGVEIETPVSPLVTFNEERFCNAVASSSDGHGNVSHAVVPGLLEVQLARGSRDRAFIQLHDSVSNRNASYSVCRQ